MLSAISGGDFGRLLVVLVNDDCWGDLLSLLTIKRGLTATIDVAF